MTPSVTCRSFGFLYGGEEINAWTLAGRAGLVLEAITYGGIVTRLLAPDKRGSLADVVLGFNDLASYVDDRQYFGAIVGRVAGRIGGDQIDADSELRKLPRNEPPNHLHGGYEGFNKKVWKATPATTLKNEPSLRLTYTSPDGEEGYPGSVRVTVTYTVTNDNIFLIESEALADKPTPVGLTHHSYFNLAGEQCGDIEDHHLQINASRFIPVNAELIPTCRVEPVCEGTNDFRIPRRVGDALPHLGRHHGDLYVVDRDRNQADSSAPVTVAQLEHKESGRVLKVRTTESHLQLYTGLGLDGSQIGKSHKAYQQHAGLCLECQSYPYGAPEITLSDSIVRPGTPQRRTTGYAFSTLRS